MTETHRFERTTVFVLNDGREVEVKRDHWKNSVKVMAFNTVLRTENITCNEYVAAQWQVATLGKQNSLKDHKKIRKKIVLTSSVTFRQLRSFLL